MDELILDADSEMDEEQNEDEEENEDELEDGELRSEAHPYSSLKILLTGDTRHIKCCSTQKDILSGSSKIPTSYSAPHSSERMTKEANNRKSRCHFTERESSHKHDSRRGKNNYGQYIPSSTVPSKRSPSRDNNTHSRRRDRKRRRSRDRERSHSRNTDTDTAGSYHRHTSSEYRAARNNYRKDPYKEERHILGAGRYVAMTSH